LPGREQGKQPADLFKIEGMAKQFLLTQFTGSEDSFHIARVTIHSRYDLSLHYHDYAEIFWVESGIGTHIINGESTPLKPGNLVMIRPADRHTFTSNKSGLTLMNLAFPAETLEYLRARYFADSNAYFWTENLSPYQALLDVALIKQLSQKAEKTWKYKKSKFYLDTLLLFIFGLITANQDLAVNNQPPAWLRNTIREFATPELFKQGVKGFAAICGKNISHVNRVVHAAYGKTLSELINELRMSFAAQQLSMTNAPIKVICDDCGFVNLGHFYKTFKETFNQTPIAYRETNQTIV
jgi:AraC-like DNA-binding protein/mannose-6-phosphate isomerase-like protein (cupin superfamily)